MSVSQSLQFNLMESTKKAGVTAGITAAASYLLFGENGSASIGSISVPTPILLGLFGAGASYTADLTHVYVIPKIPLSSSLTNTEVIAANGLSGAAGMLIGNQLLIGDLGSDTMMRLALLGGGSVVAGDLVYNEWMNKSLQGSLF